ncbi:hypothetical protein SAMN04488503_2248 [Humidesulfovibrio mexicanus]|uniref:Uncharacterized protein n=1 Tax=Humidesulfovibrio mexicanus TaxID=147047 RepID=A0A239AXB6_9BACT|nr:hypothetical protein [Humidesulfovibrio mexicanus]SNR99613.1 hypothetical protein SAMN04488503_2248 [Humidesulfovibrio mexicanus]
MRPYMTEEEAKTKTCHLMTYCYNPKQVGEGESAIYKPAKCIGSECMAWGWFPGDAPEIGRTTKGRCEAPGGAA